MDPESPMDFAALQFALPPEINQPRPAAPPRNSYDSQTPYYDEAMNPDYFESDSIPLTSQAQPMAGAANLNTRGGLSTPRDSFQTVSDMDTGPRRGRDTRSLGYGLEPTTPTGSRRPSYGFNLTPERDRRSRSPSTSDALHRAGSIMRAMSQRVVNISGEAEVLEQQASQRRSRSPSVDARHQSHLSMMAADTSYPSQVFQSTTPEKAPSVTYEDADEPPTLHPRPPMSNPLKGKSLGIFSANSVVRKKLCDVLVHPITEPFILSLIVAQLVLLTIEAAPNVFDGDINTRPRFWGTGPRAWIDWALLGLFIIFTLEIIARTIVSGFILNASEYSTVDRKKGVRAVVADQYKAVFQPQRQKSVKAPKQINLGPSAIARSFTFMQGQPVPQTVEEHQRYQLARRALLRHSFNRLDFVAVVSYWVSFLLSVNGIEKQHNLYLFRMLSSLRILRLLAITNGTTIILKSLKKAAPLLVRISFLIIFFWLLFGIIGVQTFKSSLSRTCVWIDPTDPTNRSAAFVNEEQFCGGAVDADNNKVPWVFSIDYDDLTPTNLRNGSLRAKGFTCPTGSICLQGENPEGGTISFDNIFQSIEMVFVIMSSNTFSDIMYNTVASDYLPAALFFGAGTLILQFWLINLLIAVITSTFQIIREENRGSAFTTDQDDTLTPKEQAAARPVSTLQRLYDKTKTFWILVISMSLLAQCFRSASMSRDRLKFIMVSELLTTFLLDVEILIRFMADWRGFFRRTRNLVDLFLAVVTSVILIPPIRNSGQAYAWLTIFQILRVYRVVLAVPMTSNLIRRVLSNPSGIGNLILFVFMITYFMAIFASQLFRGVLELDDDVFVTFFTIYNSFLGMWQVLSSEDWTTIVFNLKAEMAKTHQGWVVSIFFIGWFILAFFILLNMFIAVIQENFDVSEDEKRLQQVKAFLQKKELGKSGSNLALSNIFTLGRTRRRKDPLDYGPAMMEMLLKDAVVQDFLDDPNEVTETGPNSRQATMPLRAPTLAVGDVRPGVLSKIWGRLTSFITGKEPNPFYSNAQFEVRNDTLDPRQMARDAVNATTARRRAQREYLARHPSYNNSLWILTPKNPLRRMCQKLVGPGRGSERFDGVEPNKIAWYIFSVIIYAAIVAMVVLACVATPLYQKERRDEQPGAPQTAFWWVWTDTAFALIFLVEAIIKVIADGAFLTPNAYYRSSWGVIDGVVLISLLINVGGVIAQDGDVSRAIGAFKALRALRLLNISDSTRDTFHSLIIVGGWKLIGAFFVSLSLLIPFAVYGLNLFNGLMVKCNDDLGGTLNLLSDCHGEFESTPFKDDWPMLAPRVADNDYFNFDNFGNSIFILFSILSQEGWIDVMFAAQAITGPDRQPQALTSQGNAIFFIVYNLLGTVFVLTLFIAVFMRNYTEQTGVAFLTAEQRSWLELRKLLRHISPSKSSYDDSEKTWKKWCHKRAIEKKGKWYQTVTAVLVLHLILLMLEFRGEPSQWARARDFIFLIFVFVIIANVCIRLIGLGWPRFRKSSWDMYALIVVIGAFGSTTVAIILQLVEGGALEGETYIQVYKSFLVGIVLLLIPRNDALDQLFKTAAASLTTISNLLATWLVFFIVFAIALTQAFSLTRFGGSENQDINFRTVPHALILLYRMSCGEGWNILMEDYANIEPPLCVDSDNFFESDCGSKPWARFLFSAWNILSMYIFVNIFVSLIYESFSYVYQRSSGIAAVDRDEIRRFKEAWRSVDPAGTGFISKEAFPRLLGELSGVFQMRIYDPEDSVSRILEDVRNEPPTSRHASIATTSAAYAGLDLNRLNRRIAEIDPIKVRERRRRFNLFFEEVMVSADPDKGIAFGEVLMILAHYNIINDSKSLRWTCRLDEFLRRRAKLQRVDEEVRRRVVLGFFDTLYYSRQFRRHMERKNSARMTAIPQLEIPHIFVDDGEDEQQQTSATQGPSGKGKSAMLSVEDAALRTHHRSWSGSDPPSPGGAYQHPLASPRSVPPSPGHYASNSAFSFELQESGSRPGSGENSRRGSAVSPSQVRDMLDDSVWVESIRRSATIHKPDYGRY
ncbi:calcium-channel protein cch1 [Plectosphaerella plurivora]|uniref:Calcium-channel protein CCH1 n=1 Tax=Plectosphaerella plurivora TaxID=936078 RepID=A0A9P8V8Q5_9PEZI|nr:calcium-channel protein cch1 [Plectosphaerella plurivora]